MRLMVLLFFSSFAFAQQSSTTTAPCSPIAPDNTGTITINCPGMSKEQGEKMAAILNKIQAKQLDLDSIMTALAEINDKTPKLKGVLLPANDPPQPFDCGGGDLTVMLGTNGWTDPISPNILEVGDRNGVSVRRTEKGISVDAELNGEDGNIIAVIKDNRFVLNPNNVFDVQTPDDSTLIVQSVRDDTEILNVRFSNKTTVRIKATFFIRPGVRFEVNEQGMRVIGASGKFGLDHTCFAKSAGVRIR
jgi:hypothetical protein